MARYLPVLLFAASLSLTHGASLNLGAGALIINYSDPVGLPALNEARTFDFDLSDTTGLLPGDPIELSLILDSEFISTGSFSFAPGFVTLDWALQIELGAGGGSDSMIHSLSFGPIDSSDLGGAGGFAVLSGPPSLALVVPWGTDLGNVSLTLTTQTSISAPNGRVIRADITSPSLVLSTRSVPEPGPPLLAAAGFALLASRRARSASQAKL